MITTLLSTTYIFRPSEQNTPSSYYRFFQSCGPLSERRAHHIQLSWSCLKTSLDCSTTMNSKHSAARTKFWPVYRDQDTPAVFNWTRILSRPFFSFFVHMVVNQLLLVFRSFIYIPPTIWWIFPVDIENVKSRKTTRTLNHCPVHRVFQARIKMNISKHFKTPTTAFP